MSIPRARLIQSERVGGWALSLAGRGYGCRKALDFGMCLLLGAAGVGKSLLVKRLQTILQRRARGTGETGGTWGWKAGVRLLGTPGGNGV